MSNLQHTIAEKFLEKLAQSKDVDAAKLDQLRSLLNAKKVKAEDLVKIFAQPVGGDLK
jgi:hypothetical protein